MSGGSSVPPEDQAFRTLSAPDMDEDDLFAALLGVPGTGAFWGRGRTEPPVGGPERWTPEEERRRRHEDLLRKWRPEGDLPAGDVPPAPGG